MSDTLRRALARFGATKFAERHGGHKESRSARSFEYLLEHRGFKTNGEYCGSDRLRWRHQPGVKQAAVCWGCGWSGDTLDLISMLERVDRTAAIGIVVDGYNGGDAPATLELVAQYEKPKRMTLMRLPPIPWPRGYEALDPRIPWHAEPLHYLTAVRGMSLEDVLFYRIGYSRGGRLARYVIFPCFMDGALVYWQGRATWDPPPGLSKDQRKAWIKTTKYRKTLNPYSEVDETATGSSEVLFGYDYARISEHVVIVEGPIDAVKVGPHAVAMLGKVPSPEKVERLLRMAAHRYTVYLDPGEEERAYALELAVQLSDFAPTFLATPPPKCDPGQLTREQNAAMIAGAVPFRAAAGLRSNLRIR